MKPNYSKVNEIRWNLRNFAKNSIKNNQSPRNSWKISKLKIQQTMKISWLCHRFPHFGKICNFFDQDSIILMSEQNIKFKMLSFYGKCIFYIISRVVTKRTFEKFETSCFSLLFSLYTRNNCDEWFQISKILFPQSKFHYPRAQNFQIFDYRNKWDKSIYPCSLI